MRREIRVLQGALVMAALAWGGFYEFVGCAAGVFLCAFLVYKIISEKRFLWRVNLSSLAVTVLCVWYGIAVLYGADKGSAFAGFLKMLSGIMFLAVILQYEEDERREFLKAVPFAGILIIVAGVLAWLTGVGENFLFLEGRFGGTLQYSNTMAVYFLAGMIVLEEGEELSWGLKARSRTIGVAILFAGILATGSRAVFVIAAVYLLATAFLKKQLRAVHLVLLFLAAAGGTVYVVFTSDFQNIGRFLTISVHSSTFLGRFLYWRDAVALILDHPLGVGYGGYEPLQGLYQSGVYRTEFVHNDLLQYVIDVGILPTVFYAAAIAGSLAAKSVGKLRRLLLLVVVLHSLFDFDMQYLAIFYLVILCLNIDEGRVRNVELRKKWVMGMFAVPAGVWAWFASVLIAGFLGDAGTAYRLWPAYTDAAQKLLEDADSLEEARDTARDILNTAPHLTVAYNTLALGALEEHDEEAMIEYEKEALCRHPYILDEYVFYLQILSRQISWCQENGDKEGFEKCRDAALEIPDMLTRLQDRTSSLGWKIQDKPQTEMPEEMQDYLEILEQLRG